MRVPLEWTAKFGNDTYLIFFYQQYVSCFVMLCTGITFSSSFGEKVDGRQLPLHGQCSISHQVTAGISIIFSTIYGKFQKALYCCWAMYSCFELCGKSSDSFRAVYNFFKTFTGALAHAKSLVRMVFNSNPDDHLISTPQNQRGSCLKAKTIYMTH